MFLIVIGKIVATPAALHIGYGRGFHNFKGYIDEVKLIMELLSNSPTLMNLILSVINNNVGLVIMNSI